MFNKHYIVFGTLAFEICLELKLKLDWSLYITKKIGVIVALIVDISLNQHTNNTQLWVGVSNSETLGQAVILVAVWKL